MNLHKKYLVVSLVYAVIGMSLGIYMAASHDHGQFVTHAHILLVGFVISFVYGSIHRLWLIQPSRVIANLQFWLHQIASPVLAVGLFILYRHAVPESALEPFLAAGAVCILVGMLLMIYMVFKFCKDVIPK